MNRSDALADFVEMTVTRFAKDQRFRFRLMAEADETPREAAHRVRLDATSKALRRIA
ncbi:hypothetical protein [Microbacterium sp. J1-1]|uniref:hypothetical protein n=1 Tax=Microbacterium sp. J1-1 TaxID=2992441 RepID=UPI002115583B|nr:hypothetical protein [Microbacterium sp. J1-1]UUE19342.1 hypothetical protein LRQ07_11025 [Microbacterium sp. J1-1]